MKSLLLAGCLVFGTAVGLWAPSAVGQPAADDASAVQKRLAELKSALAQSQQNLKSYEWIETTVVSLKGEEKSRSQQRCYYGEDGKLQKVPVAATPEPEKPRGIRGRIAEKKKEQLSDYMKQAVQQVRMYIPPDPALLQKSKDDGKVSIAILDPGKRVRLDFGDYLLPGDTFKIEIDLITNRPSAASISTFVVDTNKKGKDPVSLDVRFGSLRDGTTYAEQVVLTAKAKDIRVEVSNSGYRKMSDSKS